MNANIKTQDERDLMYFQNNLLKKEIEQLREALRKALLWTDEEWDVEHWRKEAESLMSDDKPIAKPNE